MGIIREYNVWEFILYSLAVLYSSVAFVQLIEDLNTRQIPNKPLMEILHVPRFKILTKKPFSCEFCMAFWFALVLFWLPMWIHLIFAAAGTAYLLHALVKRLETILIP